MRGIDEENRRGKTIRERGHGRENWERGTERELKSRERERGRR